MTCENVQASDVVERYVTNTLPDEERETFEEHYFACDSCFATLQAVLATRQALRSTREITVRRRPIAWWAWAAAAAAPGLLVAGAPVGRSMSSRNPTPQTPP